MSAQQAINNMIQTGAASAFALSHIKGQKKINEKIDTLGKGVDSMAAKIADDTWRQKFQALGEQKQKVNERMAAVRVLKDNPILEKAKAAYAEKNMKKSAAENILRDNRKENIKNSSAVNSILGPSKFADMKSKDIYSGAKTLMRPIKGDE